MKTLLVAVIASFLCLLAARAQGPDEQYVQIYNVIEAADSLNNSGQSSEASAKYAEARTALQRFQRTFPTWNPQMLRFRINYVDGKIGTLSGAGTIRTAPASVPIRAPSTNVSVASTENRAPARPVQSAPGPVPEEQSAALKEQLQQLQTEKSVLEAKLKEAFTAQPAAVDPQQLTKAETKIKSLQKENDLLKVTVEQTKQKVPAALTADAKNAGQQTITEINEKLAAQTETANRLAMEKKTLQTRLDSLNATQPTGKEVGLTKKALDEANRLIAEQKKEFAKLTQEKEALQAQLQSSKTNSGALAALREENKTLKKQLTEKKAIPPTVNKKVDAAAVAQAQAKIVSLESDKEILRLEKIALENRLKVLTASTNIATRPMVASQSRESGKAKQRETEITALPKKAQPTPAEPSENKPKTGTGGTEELQSQVSSLRARLNVIEARAVPYTAEELALFKKPEQALATADPNAGKKSVKELPPGAPPLVAEAQRYFAAKQPEKAEEKYLQVLRMDENNVFTLANLAAIQLELDKTGDAEQHVTKAVTLDPGDAYSLTILGYLKFKQKKYDDALDALSRAANLEPQNPEIQNYLGLTLSQKGLRGPAETALRKAIQIEPSYGSAHNNLAVIYVTQTPPALELARWHYQKALASGHPHNEALEKMLDARKLAVKGE